MRQTLNTIIIDEIARIVQSKHNGTITGDWDYDMVYPIYRFYVGRIYIGGLLINNDIIIGDNVEDRAIVKICDPDAIDVAVKVIEDIILQHV